MKFYEKLTLPILNTLNSEIAHDLSILILQSNLIPGPGKLTSNRLKINICGLNLPNPLGLAAGYDKNAKVVPQLAKLGFGFIEVGAATPLPQKGNPKPRIFRLKKDLAIINRLGFNNEGMHKIKNRLAKYSGQGIVGINIGANKNSSDQSEDYCKVLAEIHSYVDYVTINISSPNTKNLRQLQSQTSLKKLLQKVDTTKNNLANAPPIFLKISPELTSSEIQEISALATEFYVDGIIATNTTLERKKLLSKNQNQDGGLSGQPLFLKSNKILAQFSRELDGKIPLIGVGGASSALEVYSKIKAGASAVQLYSALIYNGFSLIEKIVEELDVLVKNDGYENIQQAVGIEREKWL